MDDRVALVDASEIPWYVRSYFLWIEEVTAKSGSQRTPEAYGDTYRSFADWLIRFYRTPDSGAAEVADIAQMWAARPNRVGAPPAPATVAQRLAIISSFYRFAIKRGHFDGPNPIERVDRPKVERYKDARALDFATVRRRFAEIDRFSPEGIRDHALLTLAMHTGRRSAELAALNWSDVEVSDAHIATVHWRRLKGGKSSTDTLDPIASAAVMRWMDTAYGPSFARALVDPERPLWLSFARDLQTGQYRRLSPRSIAYICNKRMGTPRVHDLRHTFAAAMEEAGAKVSEIQAYLGHESIATTGLYLRKIRSSENPYAGRVSALLGTDS
jgi:integrase